MKAVFFESEVSKLGEPQRIAKRVTPIECRIRNLNYETEIKVDINYWKVDIINL